MKIIPYLCRAYQIVWATAYAVVPDKKNGIPIEGHPVLLNKQTEGLRVQHD